jgi:3-oxoadipate enol-lactonase
MALVAVNGIQLNITDSGAPADKPDGPVLVMGHGLLFSTEMWRHQIEVLRSTYRCIAVDWRGQGQTPPTATGYDMDTSTSGRCTTPACRWAASSVSASPRAGPT